ncbi:MAG: glycosyltransferase [Clostridia bacterium]|jgi:hypothetical protein|nr:glycosyltransferase [Clostridia bacterium]MDD4275748.1 glycosyltransferase [Clostridia bacterium]
MDYSVVIPVGKTNKYLQKSFEHIKLIMQKYSSNTEFIFVNDSLNLECTEVLNKIKKNNKSIKLINLKKPQGEQISVTIGITEAHGDAVIILNSYLPENWSMIEYAIDAYKAGNSVVHGRVMGSKFKEFILKIEDKIIAEFIKMIGVKEKVWYSADIEIYSRQAINIMLENLDKNKFLRNVNIWKEMDISSYYFEYNANNLKSKSNNEILIKYEKSNRKFEKGNSYLLSLVMVFLVAVSILVWLILFSAGYNFVDTVFNLIYWVMILFLVIITFMAYVKHLINARLGRSYLKAELDKIE